MGASSTAPSTTISAASRGVKGNDALRGRLAEMRGAEAKAAGPKRSRLPFGFGGNWSSGQAAPQRQAPQHGRRHEEYLVARLATEATATNLMDDNAASSPARASDV